MFGLQPTHILIILVVAILFFAPSRLPELVRSFKKTIHEFKGSIKETSEDVALDKSKPPEK